MTNAKMKVEVWSDIMCPFCYIGKRNYEAALEQFTGKENVEIVWKSFQLDPSIPEASTENASSPVKQNISQYLADRKGISYEEAAEMNAAVTEMAKSAGLDYHLDKAVVANSFKAHRVIQMAKTKGSGDLAEENIFKAYFTEGQDLGNTEVLMEAGLKTGLSEAEVKESLSNDEYAYRVKQDITEAGQLGIQGVPFFVFNRKYAISGAQPPAAFLQTLEKAFAEWKKEHPVSPFDVTGGPSCTPDGNCD